MTDQQIRIAAVTGASRGIGRAIAEEFARSGIGVALIARDPEALKDAVHTALKLGAPVAESYKVDLKDPAVPRAVVEGIVEKHRRLDILINSAGDTQRGDFLSMADEPYWDGFEVKFHAAVRFCRSAWAHLSASRGCIVNIAGVTAHTPSADFTVGGPVNAALVNFTKALSGRASLDHIRVNAVCPGHIATTRLRRRIEMLSRTRRIGVEAAQEELRRSLGIQRFGAPEEIATVVNFLCSEGAGYLHGEVINVDGGATPGL